MGETLLLLGSCILPLPLPILEENPKTQGQDLKSRPKKKKKKKIQTWWLMKLGEKTSRVYIKI